MSVVIDSTTNKNPVIDGTSIRCNDDCGRHKKVAEIHVEEGCVELVSRHHGTNHIAKIPIREVLESIAGTQTYPGVAKWLERVYQR